MSPDDLAEGESAALLGEWWIVSDVNNDPLRMYWAGGRELYDEACAIAQEKFGIVPIAIPLSAFVPVSDPSEGE